MEIQTKFSSKLIILVGAILLPLIYLKIALGVVNINLLIKLVIWTFFVMLIFGALKVLLLTFTYKIYINENGVFEEYFPNTQIDYLWQDFQDEEFVYQGKKLKTIRLYFKNKKQALTIIHDVYNFDELAQFIKNKILKLREENGPPSF